MTEGRHRGGICPVCSHRILVRDGKLVKHTAQIGDLANTRRHCAGSGGAPVPELWGKR